MNATTPNFTGWQAIILAEEDGNTDRLRRQLGVLGIKVQCQWKPVAAADVAVPAGFKENK